MAHVAVVRVNSRGKIIALHGLPSGLKGKRFDDVFEFDNSGEIFKVIYNGEVFTASKIKVEDGYIFVLMPESLHHLIEDFPFGVMVIEDGKITYANKKVEEFSGYSSEELYRMDLTEMVVEEDRDKIEKIYKEEKTENEVKIRRKDGKEIFIEMLTIKSYYQRKPVVLCGMAEITRRKEFQNLFLALANQAFSVVYILQDGKFVFLNETSTLSGYSREELFKMNPFDLVHPDDREMVIGNYLRRIRGENVEVPYRFRIVTKFGEVKYVDAIATRVEYRGKPAVMGMLIDRTDEMRSQEKLKMYERFFKEAKDMFFIIDRKGRFIDVNPRYAEILGYEYSELIGHTSRKISFEEDIEILRDNFRRVLNGESVKFTFRARSKNGSERVFEVVEWPVFKNGEIVGAEGVLRDITDRLKTERELKKTNDLLKTISEINELIFREKDEYSLLSKVCRVISKLRGVSSWAWVLEKDKILKATPLAPECILAEKSKDGVLRYMDCSCHIASGKSLAIPILHNSHTFGILVLCGVGELSSDEIKIFEELGENLGFAISSYKAERDRKIALNLLLDNLEQFEDLADRLRNPVAIISGFLEIKDDIGHERAMREIEKQVERIKNILDDLRLQETLTYFILRGGKV